MTRRRIPGRRLADIEVGVALRTDTAGWVTVFETSEGCAQPIAFLPAPGQLQLLLVPAAGIDMPAALQAVRDHGPFTSLEDVHAAIRPVLRIRRVAGPGGSL